MLILIGIGLALWQRRRRRGPTPLQSALAELEALEANTALSPPEKLQALSILMKRVAMSLYSREEVAGLSGEVWSRWMVEKMGKAAPLVNLHALSINAPYQPNPSNKDWMESIEACRAWLGRLSEKSR